MDNSVYSSWEVIRYNDGTYSEKVDYVATETPITVMLNNEEFATVVCSPTDLHDLLIGFLASEGIIRVFDEIKQIHIDETRGFAYVNLHKSLAEFDFDHSKRFIGSCCGKSRQFYFKNDVRTARTVQHKLEISALQCITLMKLLQDNSGNFQMTGGVHNAALCTTDKLLTIRTDIGRHNALDKVFGHILQNNTPIQNKVIVFSGRVSSEVLLKVAKIGIAVLISTSAPTDLALKLADDLGITVVGFVRDKSMNIYTHEERITK